MTKPLVSVVTPFHDTARYLPECIESVLAQSYSDFEYILVDNCSTDGSGEIAESYARKDSRIRFLRRSKLLSQVQNYNAALAEISSESQYCKIVQADDFIFPECLTKMVAAFEQSPSIGLVSSYDLKGDAVRGSGFPFRTAKLDGREMARLYLRTGLFVFGSPTTVMYRSSIVRAEIPFYQENLLHEDTERCMQILKTWDFAFVPQVLSFLRIEAESVTGRTRAFQPNALDGYIIARRFASQFLDNVEAENLKEKSKREYYQVLARGAIRAKGAAFWRYHRAGLATVGETIDRPYLFVQLVTELLWNLANPGITILNALTFLRRKKE